MVSKNIVRVIEKPDDGEALSQMMLAATFAGIGFGNAGVHLPHGMSYPVSGVVRSYTPEGYPADHATIPHGMAVVLNAPSVFRFTGKVNPGRHLEAARLMGADVASVGAENAGNALADAVISLMKKTRMSSGQAEVGFTAQDIDRLVQGTIPQQRITSLSPRPFTPEDLKRMFAGAMRYW